MSKPVKESPSKSIWLHRKRDQKPREMSRDHRHMTGVCKLSLQFSSGPSRCSFSTTLGQFHSGCLAKDCQLSDAVPSHNSTHLNPQPNPLCCWAGVCKGPWHLCSFSSLAPGECHTGVFSFICGQIPFFFFLQLLK